MEKMVWAFEFAFVVQFDQCYVIFVCQVVAAWSDDGEKGVAKLFIHSCQLNLLDLYKSVLLLCTLIISFEIRVG